ncbi:MAG: hypothetical protein AB9891_12495 [Anaerolineaceae bacterium]
MKAKSAILLLFAVALSVCVSVADGTSDGAVLMTRNGQVKIRQRNGYANHEKKTVNMSRPNSVSSVSPIGC